MVDGGWMVVLCWVCGRNEMCWASKDGWWLRDRVMGGWGGRFEGGGWRLGTREWCDGGHHREDIVKRRSSGLGRGSRTDLRGP